MAFTPEELAEIGREYQSVKISLSNLVTELLARWEPKLTMDRAKEYLKHGVCRRLMILERCLEQVFTICPADRTKLLDRDERADIEIALQAFVVNIYGSLDNLAWVLVHEADLNLSRPKVNLLRDDVKKLLNPVADAYLQDPKIKGWYPEPSPHFQMSPKTSRKMRCWRSSSPNFAMSALARSSFILGRAA